MRDSATTARERQLGQTIARVARTRLGDSTAERLLGGTVEDVSRMAVAAEQLRICRSLAAEVHWVGSMIPSVALEHASLHSAAALWHAVSLGGGAPEQARALATRLLGVEADETARPDAVVQEFAAAVSRSLQAGPDELAAWLLDALAHALALHVIAVEGVPS